MQGHPQAGVEILEAVPLLTPALDVVARSPRALRRGRVSAGPQGRRDPPGGPRLRGGGRARRDDPRSTRTGRPARSRRRSWCSRTRQASSSTRAWSRPRWRCRRRGGRNCSASHRSGVLGSAPWTHTGPERRSPHAARDQQRHHLEPDPRGSLPRHRDRHRARHPVRSHRGLPPRPGPRRPHPLHPRVVAAHHLLLGGPRDAAGREPRGLGVQGAEAAAAAQSGDRAGLSGRRLGVRGRGPLVHHRAPARARPEHRHARGGEHGARSLHRVDRRPPAGGGEAGRPRGGEHAGLRGARPGRGDAPGDRGGDRGGHRPRLLLLAGAPPRPRRCGCATPSSPSACPARRAASACSRTGRATASRTTSSTTWPRPRAGSSSRARR